jgi:hypothetical protein
MVLRLFLIASLCIASSVHAALVDWDSFDQLTIINNKSTVEIFDDDAISSVIAKNISISLADQPNQMLARQEALDKAVQVAFFILASEAISSKSTARSMLSSISEEELRQITLADKVLEEDFHAGFYRGLFQIEFKKMEFDSMMLKASKLDTQENDSIILNASIGSDIEWEIIKERLKQTDLRFNMVSFSATNVQIKLYYKAINFNDLRSILLNKKLDIRRTLNKYFIYAI